MRIERYRFTGLFSFAFIYCNPIERFFIRKRKNIYSAGDYRLGLVGAAASVIRGAQLVMMTKREIIGSRPMKFIECPLCGGNPVLVDDRVQFFVTCENHKPPRPVVYGQSIRHLDYIEDDDESQKAFDSVDWEAVKQSAIDAWNAWAIIGVEK